MIPAWWLLLVIPAFSLGLLSMSMILVAVHKRDIQKVKDEWRIRVHAAEKRIREEMKHQLHRAIKRSRRQKKKSLDLNLNPLA